MCKVDVVTDRYGLAAPSSEYDSLDAYLLARWTGRGEAESAGYKSLTEWFNRRLLARIYEEHDRTATGVRVESEYEALQGADDARRAEVADDLRRDGIDPESARRAFISWSTMRRHLNDCLGGEKPRAAATTDWEVNSVDVARGRVEEKARAALRSLSSKDRLRGAADAAVEVDVTLSCPDCGAAVSMADAVERGYVCDDHSAFGGAARADSDSDAPERESSLGVLPAETAFGLLTSTSEQFVPLFDAFASLGVA
ncbi:rod-determining factor RdfA [Halopelagius fulvigenes]|uniref:Rod-determining factor RdfA n=1 Tax=Halopelagius fulvigenes TaxID=1198324 RepID=A0ABD5U2J7_9EURY